MTSLKNWDSFSMISRAECGSFDSGHNKFTGKIIDV